jgi:hypothetical protein
VPGVPQEIASNTRPSSANEPHFILLEDDALIPRINVETDQLLAAPDPSQVRVNIRASRVILAIQFCSHNTFNACGSNSGSFAVREQKSSCEPSACDTRSHMNASRLSVGLRVFRSVSSKGPYRTLAWEWRALPTCWYQRRTCSKCGVNLVSEQVPEVDHGAGMAGCRPVDYTFVKPSGDWVFDKPRIFIVFLVIAG